MRVDIAYKPEDLIGKYHVYSPDNVELTRLANFAACLTFLIKNYIMHLWDANKHIEEIELSVIGEFPKDEKENLEMVVRVSNQEKKRYLGKQSDNGKYQNKI